MCQETLDPQDVGLGVFAGRSGQDGEWLGELACGLSGRRQDVWSQVVPRQHDGCNVDPGLICAEQPHFGWHFCPAQHDDYWDRWSSDGVSRVP